MNPSPSFNTSLRLKAQEVEELEFIKKRLRYPTVTHTIRELIHQEFLRQKKKSD